MSTAVLSLQAAPPKALRGTYFVQTWGCQMNEEDSDQIGLSLESIGFSKVDTHLSATIILLNTCSVRKKPEDKAFSFLGELALLKRKRPEIVIGVCGCMAQIRADDIRRTAKHVDFVVGTGQIISIAGLVEETLQTRKFRSRLELPERKGAVVTDVPKRLLPEPERNALGEIGESQILQLLTDNRQPTTVVSQRPLKIKAFVPIQYGCDKFCTFCIVPTTRGRERSRPTEEVVVEVRRLAELGVKEVTLLGQTVNSYGKNLAEGRVPFGKLLWLLEGIPGLERLRYMSPYPRDFKADLIECIRDNPKVMEHVHLPLQSGDADLLQAMKRQYSVDEFLQIVDDLRAAVPNMGITTDIIVGFPGETEAQFENTLNVVKNVRFDGAYMFIYSPRPGTPAAEMEQLPYKLKHERLQTLMDLQNQITIEKNLDWIGKTVEVLVEGPSKKNPDVLQGYSREWKMVHFRGDPSISPGDLVNVKLTEAFQWGLRGTI